MFLFLATLSANIGFADPFQHRKSYDAASTRGLIIPSAETLDKGSFTVSSLEVLFYSLSYGITDNAMVSFSSLLPFAPGIPFFGVLSAKFKLFSSEKMSFSLQPNTFVTPTGSDFGLVGLQAIADISLFDNGGWILTMSANPQVVYGSFDNSDLSLSDGAAGLLGASIQGYVHPRVKFMGEIFVPGALSFDTNELSLVDEAFLLNYGVRFPGENVSFDVTFIRPVDGGVYLGWPFVAATGLFR